jgi:hypothetical protein
MCYMSNDPTEVKSYFLSSLIDTAVDWGASALSSGADALSSAVDWGADALASIPIAGETLSNGLGSIGDFGVEMLNGNFSTALGDLYGGVDTLVGGILPGGQAFSQGYLSNLYSGADNMLGGYLPGGQTPAQMQAAASAAQIANTPIGQVMPGGSTSGAMVEGGGAAGGGGFWDSLGFGEGGAFAKGGTIDNIANTAAIGGTIYSLLNPRDQGYARSVGEKTQFVRSGGGPSNIVTRNDPAMQAASAKGVGVGNQQEGSNKTPGLDQVGGVDEEIKKTGDLANDMEKSVKDLQDIVGNNDGGPMAQARNPIMSENADPRGGMKNNAFRPMPAPAPIPLQPLQLWNPGRPQSNIPGGPRAEYLSRPQSNIPGGPRAEYLAR